MRLHDSIYWALTAWGHWGKRFPFNPSCNPQHPPHCFLSYTEEETENAVCPSHTTNKWQLSYDLELCVWRSFTHPEGALWKWLAYVGVSWRRRSRAGCSSFLIEMKYHVLHPLPTSRFLWLRIWLQLLLATGSCPMGSDSLFHLPETERNWRFPYTRCWDWP